MDHEENCCQCTGGIRRGKFSHLYKTVLRFRILKTRLPVRRLSSVYCVTRQHKSTANIVNARSSMIETHVQPLITLSGLKLASTNGPITLSHFQWLVSTFFSFMPRSARGEL